MRQFEKKINFRVFFGIVSIKKNQQQSEGLKLKKNQVFSLEDFNVLKIYFKFKEKSVKKVWLKPPDLWNF
jgi:hypothetical protein